MPNDKQDQNQAQYINFAEKHGIVDSAFCQYFTSSIIESLAQFLNSGGLEYRIKAAEKIHSSKMVKFLVYEGKTVKVICHLFCVGKCKSQLNTLDDKACIFL